jgi:hypothetical protein
MVTPYFSPKSPRKPEKLSAFSMPSAPQKRLSANGRSIETLSTVTPGFSVARLLNVRTDVAHTPVSMLGKMLSTRLPGMEDSFLSDKSILVSVASGACAPTAGRAPFVSTGLPFRVILAMRDSLVNEGGSS